MRYLLDTNAIIMLLKSTESPVARRARGHAVADIGLSAIVAHELYFGAYKSARREDNLRRLDALRFEIVAFDKRMRRRRERSALRSLATASRLVPMIFSSPDRPWRGSSFW